jgi:hypothetical protein
MNDLRVVNLSTYTSPEIVEKSNKEWVSYGADNNYFSYLIDRYNGSPTNNAIINGISEMIYGKGLDALNSNKKPEQYAKMVSLFHKDCVRKLCYDLKLMGQCSMQVIYSKDRKTVARVEHIPVENLRAEKCNDKGEIEAYYYSDDWTKVKNVKDCTRIPAFGYSKEPIEIVYVKPYRAGYKYYSSPDYQGVLSWCETEEQVSIFHLNNTAHSFSPNTLIQFNNGTPNAEERQMLENRIAQKFTGVNGAKFILAFNDNPENAATVETLQISDAHNTYQYVSEECTKKIMVGHRVVSPMLLGIKDSSGLGNNADELKTASILMDNTVIRPFQTLLIDAFDSILAYNNISLKLYFKTLQPLEFTDLENVVDEETREEETGVKLSQELADNEADYILENLKGEEVDEEWELVDEREYSEDNTDIETWANKLIEPKKSLLQKFAESIPNLKKGKGDFSVLDKSYYKVRYRYAEKYSSTNTRTFCKALMARNMVYRIEDIDAASDKGVNESFGHKGKKYDLFRFKGGVNCGHYWSEQLYRLKKKTNGKYIEKSDKIKDYVEVDDIPKSYKGKPRGWKDAKKAPKDMANNGHHPNYKN